MNYEVQVENILLGCAKTLELLDLLRPLDKSRGDSKSWAVQKF